MELVITFENTHSTISAEQAALSAGISVGVMSLPSKIKAGCGLCLRISETELERFKSAIFASMLDYSGIYVRNDSGGEVTYTIYEE